ncbi:MAG: hypothetical protein RSA84_19235 [Acinetobacter sp.]
MDLQEVVFEYGINLSGIGDKNAKERNSVDEFEIHGFTVGWGALVAKAVLRYDLTPDF